MVWINAVRRELLTHHHLQLRCADTLPHYSHLEPKAKSASKDLCANIGPDPTNVKKARTGQSEQVMNAKHNSYLHPWTCNTNTPGSALWYTDARTEVDFKFLC